MGVLRAQLDETPVQVEVSHGGLRMGGGPCAWGTGARRSESFWGVGSQAQVQGSSGGRCGGSWWCARVDLNPFNPAPATLTLTLTPNP